MSIDSSESEQSSNSKQTTSSGSFSKQEAPQVEATATPASIIIKDKTKTIVVDEINHNDSTVEAAICSSLEDVKISTDSKHYDIGDLLELSPSQSDIEKYLHVNMNIERPMPKAIYGRKFPESILKNSTKNGEEYSRD